MELGSVSGGQGSAQEDLSCLLDDTSDENPSQCRRCKGGKFEFLGQEDLGRKWQPNPAFLLENPMAKKELGGLLHQITESNRTEVTASTSMKAGGWGCVPALLVI